MQIKNIIIYKDETFEPRVLSFDIGAVNIITGESATGKTAIIDIVDYCLGSSSFNVKGSKIRDNVSWFAITIKLANEEVFIARQNPTFLGKQSTNAIYFKYGDKISIQSYNDLVNNSTTAALTSFISNKLGIDDNLHTAVNNTRDSLEATFKHSRLFSFQPQNVIAEFKYLFFNQDDPFVAQAIKDTLPYILGAIRKDELLIQQRLAQKKKELNKYLREQKLEESIQAHTIRQLNTLVEEAKELELINNNTLIMNDDEAIEELKKILQLDGVIQGVIAENEQIAKLIEDKKNLRLELTDIKNEINAVEDFSGNVNTFESQSASQYDRLLSIGLYKEPESKEYWNALLGQEASELVPSLEAINTSLKALQNGLKFTEKEKPKVQKILIELEKKKTEKIIEIKAKEKSIQNIYTQKKELDKLKNRNIQKGRVLGKISLFFDSINFTVKDSSLNLKINSLQSDIEELEASISQEDKENRINAILNKINIIISSWSDKLSWEYQEFNLRFNIKKLTIFADSDNKSESLQQMGSGENWLACHLLIHLALHKHFIDTKRPVPNFIIFDQPTQVHYPKGYKENSTNKLDSNDEVADQKMFKFIFNIVKELSPDLQVIITDHADFDDKYFRDAVVEKWRNGEKLVPEKWLK